MSRLRRLVDSLKTPQWILIGVGLASGAAALIIGVSDNPPGIVLLYFSLTCLAGAWVWNWRSPREFWGLLLTAVLAFPVGAIAHNLLYALGTLIDHIPVVREAVSFLGVFFFLVAVMAAGPAGLVGLIGGIITSWRGMDRLVRINRSCRRFQENSPIQEKTLRGLVNLARESASGANLQPLKFILSCTPEKNQRIFPCLAWAAYLKDWAGPEVGERPAGYIIILGDLEISKSFQYDAGIASQSITLGAAERGLGACLIASIQRDQLRSELAIPDRCEILLVIALGKPAETILLEELEEGGEVRYWRDERGRHHVPKRRLEDLILDS